MKVSTDAILLGAWTRTYGASRALDIGTGTGILALMLVQKEEVLQVDAIESNFEAFLEAKENFFSSPWPGRLHPIHVDLRSFEGIEGGYDLIICNPPYFSSNQLTSSSPRKEAREQEALDHNTLLSRIDQLLDRAGVASLILPVEEGHQFLEKAHEGGLNSLRRTYVHYKPEKAAARLLLELGRSQGHVPIEQLSIQVGKANQYSPEFISLARDFYRFMGEKE